MPTRRTYSFTFLTTLTTLVLVVGVAVALVFIGYDTSTAVGTRALKDRFGLLYEGASTYLKESVRSVGIAQRTMIAQRTAGDDPRLDLQSSSHAAMAREPYRSLVAFSNEFPVLSSVYFGYGDGSFAYYADLRRWTAERRATLATPADAVHMIWQIRRADGRVEAWRAFYDADGVQLLRRVNEAESYDPRRRPWYREAAQADTTILTEPYVFASTPQLGLTVATRFASGPVVAGADMVLDDVARFASSLRLAPSSLVVVFTREGWVVGERQRASGVVPAGAAAMAGSDDEILHKLMSLGLHSAASAQSVQEGGRNYLLAAAPIRLELGRDVMLSMAGPDTGRGLFLGVATPVDEMNAELRRSMAMFAAVGLGGLLFGAVMAVISARALARPISRLGSEARRLADLNFTPVAMPVGSRVAEVRDLADALERARNALRIFATYVPRQLVERLIRNPAQAGVGGENRRISIMFTDVAGYTAIAERLDAQRLMTLTSAYFDRLGHVIAAHDGIIDKFVGDSIMAIWNAPDLNPDHVDDCCRAALAIAAAVEAFNGEADARGEPRFETRIGIHCGDCVVGNVGSADRLNYTAIGSEVNLASRVEGLNGLYGTTILASQAVVEAAGHDFLFRWIDRVQPVGMAEGIDVHELLGERAAAADGGELARLLELWQAAAVHYRGERYAEAERAFKTLLARFPDDRPSRLMAERCGRFARMGPPEGWRGVFPAPSKVA